MNMRKGKLSYRITWRVILIMVIFSVFIIGAVFWFDMTISSLESETRSQYIIAISLLIALNPPTFIAQLMGISWGALAGAFLAPFMLGLYWRGVTTASVWACFIWGVGLTVINMLAGNPINPINCGAIAMVGGFPIVWIVSLLSKKMDSTVVTKIFECYK